MPPASTQLNINVNVSVSKRFIKDSDLTATIKRLVKPWFGSGRTVIADSWFGSPDMTAMLSDLGLYSIMQVTKRRYWPRGMPVTDIVEQLESAHGSHYTMKKNSGSGTMFVCSYRDRRVKAFISSCGTTSRLGGQRTSVSSGSLEVAVSRPNVVNEYETHKSSVDAANNLRDNKISYHDIISTERWEMRFFGFFLGICEANAFSAYRVFNENGGTTHSAFKDSLAWFFLKHCEVLNFGSTSETIDSEPRNLTIENPHDKAVAFKVKTTAPKLYCVRPNSDVIPPNSSIDVQIMLQAQREEPPLDVKCRDKFLILSIFLNETTEKMGITELWNHVEGNDKDNIEQHKLRCVYVQSSETKTSTAPAPVPAAGLAPTAPVAAAAPAPAAVSARSIPTETSTRGDTNESQKDQEDVIEKLKAMEKELNKYKEAEKLEIKTGFPPSIYILIGLMIAAIAYFIATK
ncbi:hypothetical protein HMPREF1544_01737 [Mucor circinelloides 1006PhL]|uniref:MSP domain-containing protein n=1 Tax=Mucor circinelloides f. circinelloides (strain 1006PhL) TaxID=1220926 RepID=S2KGB1_MUCC1|nr:hypothetical protein HMPREF1544_01737 [Mucor circinelloides 1006PhL]